MLLASGSETECKAVSSRIRIVSRLTRDIPSFHQGYFQNDLATFQEYALVPAEITAKVSTDIPGSPNFVLRGFILSSLPLSRLKKLHLFHLELLRQRWVCLVLDQKGLRDINLFGRVVLGSTLENRL